MIEVVKAPPRKKDRATSARARGFSLFADGVDRRSKTAKRFDYLVAAYTKELGGVLTTSQHGAVSNLAAHAILVELVQADLVQGLPVDHEQFVRLSNNQRRLMEGLGLSTNPATCQPGPAADVDLAAYLGEVA